MLVIGIAIVIVRFVVGVGHCRRSRLTRPFAGSWPELTGREVGRELAVVENYENGENTNAAGKRQQLSIRATNLFRKEDGKWKMIGHHTDLLPYLQE